MLKAKVNGIELAFERLGRGTPLVLIHGHPLDHVIWEPILPLLENDFDLILPDLRGFGQSETLRTSYLLTDMAADIVALLDHLNIERAAIAGHSMGGYIALAFARAYPEHVHGLGLVASNVFADPPERKPSRYETAAEIEKQGIGILADSFPSKLTTNSALHLILHKIILRQSVHGAAESLRAMAERADSSTFLEGFKFPVVVVHGTADALIPVERAREAKALAEKIQLIVIEGVGHMPMMESPQKTASALKMLK
jgi:pimeloyl-ACP methyl ester carboxylesterase